MPAAIAFHDARAGLLGTTRDIKVTQDGGRTWRVVFRTPRPVTWIGYDASGRTRAILADGENLGGPRWQPEAPVEQLTPCPAGVNRSVRADAWFLCIGQGSAGSGEKIVYHVTRDGARRVAWALLGPKLSVHGITAQGYAAGMAMTHAGFGVIWQSRGPLLVTRNGGLKWIELPKVAVPEVDFGISGAAVRGGVAWVILARGDVHRRLLETTDAGATWRVVHRWR